ncbi:MAG TPA: sugar kinase, partial [Ktedonobacter sp.]|nr:sugar kinase [Ktedonobacter sp.]
APDDLHPEVFSGIRLLHVTGITPALSPTCAATVERAIELAHAAGAVVSFDPNYRPTLWNPVKARSVLLPLIQKADILLIGHEDSQAIFGVDDEESIVRATVELGCKLVVLKRGDQGACAWDGKIRVSIPAEHVEEAIDPVGAGDAFGAGFLAGWLHGSTLEEALSLGIRAGAATVMTAGDYISQEQFSQMFTPIRRLL